jgi:L-fuculose-phosphate aldolase
MRGRARAGRSSSAAGFAAADLAAADLAARAPRTLPNAAIARHIAGASTTAASTVRAGDMTREERQLRAAIIAKCKWMNASGLNQGTSGNISARYKDRMLITPSATAYDAMMPDMIASMPLDGKQGAEEGVWSGPLKPSTEWRFHRDILRARPEVGGIVHTHSTYATVLAIARKSIPACHYMVAAFGGSDVRCAGYALYGTKELSELALAALQGRNACLLANHGAIALGAGLDKAMWHAVELETLARQYYLALALDSLVILSDAEIADVAKGFSTYGLQRPQSKVAKAPAKSRPKRVLVREKHNRR